MPHAEAPLPEAPQSEEAEPETGLLAEERDRLDELLDDLLGLKARLQAARERTD
jgi:hypothetical protein